MEPREREQERLRDVARGSQEPSPDPASDGGRWLRRRSERRRERWPVEGRRRTDGGLCKAGIGAKRPAGRGGSVALGRRGKSVKSVKSVVLYPPLRAYAFCAFAGDAFNTPVEKGDGGSLTSLTSLTNSAVIDDFA